MKVLGFMALHRGLIHSYRTWVCDASQFNYREGPVSGLFESVAEVIQLFTAQTTTATSALPLHVVYILCDAKAMTMTLSISVDYKLQVANTASNRCAHSTNCASPNSQAVIEQNENHDSHDDHDHVIH